MYYLRVIRQDQNIEEIKNILDISGTHTIYSILGRMEALIVFCEVNKEYAGILPFLKTYHLVTKKVSESYLINKDYFEDFEVVEKLDIIFAGEFFKSFANLLDGKELKPWHKFYEYSLGGGEVNFLKMMLGINSHINGDLASSLYKSKFQSQNDFIKINDILLEVIPLAMNELVLNYNDIYAFGAMVFKEFTRIEFHNTVVRWRNNAWDLYISSREKSVDKSEVYAKTENKSEALIAVFNSLDLTKLPELVTKLSSI